MKNLFLPLIAAVLGAGSVHAQTVTTWALGSAACHVNSVNCQNVPMSGPSSGNLWIDVAPFNGTQGPYAERFMDGLPSSISGFAEVNNNSTYRVTYSAPTYTTPDGKKWTCGLNQCPQSMTLTFVQLGIDPTTNATYIVPGGYTGTATIVFGNYYYVDVCGFGCGAVRGWHWSVVGGTITVKYPAQ